MIDLSAIHLPGSRPARHPLDRQDEVRKPVQSLCQGCWLWFKDLLRSGCVGRVLLCAAACLGLTTFAQAHCFDLAAQRYQVPVQLLKAIAMQESGGRAHAVNRNPNGTFDIGMMQINSFWLPKLARHGISQQDLFDPCVSVLVGAWVLSDNFARLGYNTQGLGAYNAVTPYKRERYARAILQRLGHNTASAQHPVPGGKQAPAPDLAQAKNSHAQRP